MANEKRLIEVESAWEKAQKIFSDSALLLAIRVALDKAPTVEVVRCKDCIFMGMCSIREAMACTVADGFCWRGERRDNG